MRSLRPPEKAMLAVYKEHDMSERRQLDSEWSVLDLSVGHMAGGWR